MINNEIIKYSLRNLATKKSRSLLTIISIFVGIATIFIFISFGWGLHNYVSDLIAGSSANKITVVSKGIGAPGLDESFILSEDDLNAVKNTPGVLEVAGVYGKAAKIKQDKIVKYVWLIAYNPKTPLVMEFHNVDIYKGRELKKGDRGKVVLGYSYLFGNKVFPKPLDINDEIEIQDQKLRIIGFLGSVGNPIDDANIYIVEDYIDDAYPDKENNYNWLIARVDKNNIDKVISDTENNIRKSRNQEKGKEDFFISSFDDLLKTYTIVLDIIVAFVILIALISVFVSAINTSNTMITSVLERTKEIGVLKSIGAKNSDVLNIFLFESSFLGFIAGILGVIVGWLISFIAKAILTDFGLIFLTPKYSWEIFVGGIIFATLTGAISGVLPAIHASKINPVDALRYE